MRSRGRGANGGQSGKSYPSRDWSTRATIPAQAHQTQGGRHEAQARSGLDLYSQPGAKSLEDFKLAGDWGRGSETSDMSEQGPVQETT